MSSPVRPTLRRSIIAEDFRGQRGLRHTTLNAVLSQQPKTVLQALGIRGVGRKLTKRLLKLGLLTDLERVQAGAARGIVIRKNGDW
jgi:hypothetical protein